MFSTHGPPWSTTQKLNLCQTTDTPDFKFECLKPGPNFKRKFHIDL